jgi:hypothetical protein
MTLSLEKNKGENVIDRPIHIEDLVGSGRSFLDLINPINLN